MARPRGLEARPVRHRRSRQDWVKFRDSVEQAYAQKITSIERVDRGLTAAAQVLDESLDSQQPNAVTRTWQHAVFGYTYTVPELNACAMYYGNALSRCELVVGKRNPDGTVEQGFDGDEPAEGFDGAIADEAAEIISGFRAPIGGQSELLRRYGELMFLVGELYFVPFDTPAGMVWECLSTLELRRDGQNGRWTRYSGPGYRDEPLLPGTNPIRVWRPAANYSKTSSSSIRSSLEILEELVVLTRLVRASAISRMALSGILFIPDELDFPEDDEAEDGDLSEATSPLITDIVNTAAKAIDDPASAAAFVPYLLQGPAEYGEKIHHIPFQGDDQENVIKRREALERFAQGVDLPVEVVTGYEGTTYANAFQVDQDKFTFHFQPALQILCDALSAAYLWPAMAKNRGIQPEDLKGAPYPDDILQAAVTFDASKLISRPDRAKDIIEAYKVDESQTAIANAELREGVGLEGEGGPDEEEVARRLDAKRLVHIREVIQGPPSDAAVPIEQADKAVVPGKSAGREVIAEAADGRAVQQATEEATVTASATAALDSLAHRIAGGAELAAERALERIGAKLRSRLKGERAAQFASVPNARLAKNLGADELARLSAGDIDKVTQTEAVAFSRAVSRWAGEAGVDGAKEIAAGATRMLTALVQSEIHADPGGTNGHVLVSTREIALMVGAV
jgi:hypothetical protein